LTAEELRKARRAPKVLVAARIDRDVYDWLQGYGEGYSTRINAILRAVLSTGEADCVSGWRVSSSTVAIGGAGANKERIGSWAGWETDGGRPIGANRPWAG
jgi:hypothetical protein